MLCEGVELALPAASSWNANEKGVISCTRSVCTDLCGALGPKLFAPAVLLVSYSR